jgi:predicted AAA+ superfamily ATPase
LLQENISQSLAGRIGYFDLAPLTIQEIKLFGSKLSSTEDWMLAGSYPEIFDKKRNPASWYASYIPTYVERDVRMIRNISSVNAFTKFLKLCAGRVGQQLNVSNMSMETGIDIKTIQSWLCILESSFIIYQLPAHHKNFNRRLVKTPKLYFYDTGLACNLLGIKTANELSLSHFRGALFENFIVSDIRKQQMNKSELNNLFYWRDNKGIEIDLLLESKNKLQPIEIKAGKTINNDFVKNISFWNDLATTKGGEIIYGGSSSYILSDKIMVTSYLDV